MRQDFLKNKKKLQSDTFENNGGVSFEIVGVPQVLLSP
jgi:hypothetical protein